jgi:hypothetical protein
MKKSKKDNNQERDQFTVVLENINSKIDLLVEGHQCLVEKIDGVEFSLNAKIDSVESSLNSFKKETRDNFQLAFDHFSNIEDELSDIRKELGMMKKKKVDVEKFEKLERRVGKLEEIVMRKKAAFAA